MVTDYRSAYALPDDLHYLNGASLSPQLRSVTAAGIEAIQQKEVPPRIRQQHWLQPVIRLRNTFGKLLGCSGDNIATVPSASYGMSTVAQIVELKPGKRIISVERVFPSTYYTWAAFAKTHDNPLHLVAAPTTGNVADLWNEALLSAIDETCGLVCVPPIHWITGSRYNLTAIRERCDAVGALLVVDATQWLGARPFDLDDVRPDALVAAGYKWLSGPYTLSYLYLADHLHNGRPLEENWMSRAGSEDFAQLTNWTDEYRPGAARYCMGEQSHFINVAMAQVGLDKLLDWGVDTIADYTDSLVEPYWQQFAELGYTLPEAEFCSAHLFSLRIPRGADVDALKKGLVAKNLDVSFRDSYIRVSPHVSSRAADLDTLLEVLSASSR